MDVEVVRWSDKTSMDKIVNKSFTDIEEAHTYYTNWKCDEYDDGNFIVQGKNWNNSTEDISIPNKYLYTYSINLWFGEEMEHSHNFIVYKLS
jgi:hypothetical protein